MFDWQKAKVLYNAIVDITSVSRPLLYPKQFTKLFRVFRSNLFDIGNHGGLRLTQFWFRVHATPSCRLRIFVSRARFCTHSIKRGIVQCVAATKTIP